MSATAPARSLSLPVLAAGLVAGLMTLAQVSPVHGQKTAPSAAVELAVAGPAAALHPGGVGLVRVTASRPLATLQGEAFGRDIHFWATSDPSRWEGLVGLGFDVAPGQHAMTVRAAGTSGAHATARATLTVSAKKYETRRLTVAANMVNPPEEEAARIAADSKAMADVFAGVSPERLWQGPFLTPVPGAATSSFGRLSVMNGESRGRHLGADFRAGEGTPVRAPNGGRVALAQNLYFAGNTVIVDHGLGLFSLVAHLSRIDVEVGEMVTGGDQLGLSGSTGRVTGPHLHWAIRMGPQSVDPEALMAALQPQSAR
jgi:murein DD-endopeptidase MepM/ murein hydrolase activator NlpD